MPQGNFAATLALPVDDPREGALRSFVAALALREACIGLTGQDAAFALKWPNDVLLRGGKLAGILLEAIAPGYLGIGIGVNLARAPDAATLEPQALPPVSLKETFGLAIAPEEFLTPLAQAYARLETQFAAYGFAPIRSAWLAHAARLGETMTARLGTDHHEGTFADVDLQGQLVLETAKGRVAIAAADVYF